MNWYEFVQNNSGGYFEVDDKVCHRLFIEAESHYEAVSKAEELGCYWDGVEKGIDCSCCGDRWKNWNTRPVNLVKYREEGYQVWEFGNKAKWKKKYGKYNIIGELKTEKTVLNKIRCVGWIQINSIEEYAQYLANEYGWTTPDARIYYHNGTVKEIFKEKAEVR